MTIDPFINLIYISSPDRYMWNQKYWFRNTYKTIDDCELLIKSLIWKKNIGKNTLWFEKHLLNEVWCTKVVFKREDSNFLKTFFQSYHPPPSYCLLFYFLLSSFFLALSPDHFFLLVAVLGPHLFAISPFIFFPSFLLSFFHFLPLFFYLCNNLSILSSIFAY